LASKLLNTCSSPVRSIAVIGWACIVMALLLGIAEIYHRRTIGEGTFDRCDAGRTGANWMYL
jgi:undecaprenyl-diphosphatase